LAEEASSPLMPAPLMPARHKLLARRLAFLGLGCLIAAGLAAGLFGGKMSSSGSSGVLVTATREGAAGAPQRLPPLRLPRLGGGPPIRLFQTGGLVGRPAILLFFASWCTPCRKEIPMVAAVDREEAARAHTGSASNTGQVAFVGVDVNDSTSSGLAFVRQAGVDFPVGADPEDQVAAGILHLRGLPTTLFVSAEGRVEGAVLGPLSRQSLIGWVRRLEAPPAQGPSS
jgi:thiol-disulfide isomerase/thioredoxin